jgi:hypothetical protein
MDEREVEMKTGMLWYDGNRSQGMSSRIRRALDYYQKKYGTEPNLCVLHPSMLGPEDEEQIESNAGISLKVHPTVLPDHFWLGVTPIETDEQPS